MLAYAGLRSCYIVGSPLGSFTLTAHVDTAGSYRITHAVALAGVPPATPTTVYSGTIAPAPPRTITLNGGTAIVPGTYQLTAALYTVADNRMIAQTMTTILVAERCPEPTPTPAPTSIPDPTPDQPVREVSPDIRWSQAIERSQSVPAQSIVSIAIHGRNIGEGAGGSDGILRYDPTVLRLLDALPLRPGDWVRERDDPAGLLTIAFGELAPGAHATMYVRFVMLQSTTTVIRLTRSDGQDRANPLFLVPNTSNDGPMRLTTRWNDAAVMIIGHGYKPGEQLSLWANTKQEHAVAIEGSFIAGSDDDEIGRAHV